MEAYVCELHSTIKLANYFSVVYGHVKELSDGHVALVPFLAAADRDNTFSSILLAYDEEVRHLLEFALADLVTQLFVGFVDFSTYADSHEFVLYLLGVIDKLLTPSASALRFGHKIMQA